MFTEIIFLFLGIIPGRIFFKNPLVVRSVDILIISTVHVLLFILGLNMGSDPHLFSLIADLGAVSLLLGVFCALGSALVLRLYAGFFIPKTAEYPVVTVSSTVHIDSEREHAAEEAGNKQLKKAIISSLRILCFFAIGLLIGRVASGASGYDYSAAAMWILRLMLFAVGMGLGFDLRAFGIVRQMGLKILFLPVLVAAGTGLGAVITSMLVPSLSPAEAVCAGAGFGYYSLSSVILGELGNISLGSVALMSNITRELFTLLFAPLLVRFFGHFGPVASGGATAMDTCLPVITRFSGESYGILAVFSGITLTVAVPVILPIMYKIFF